MKPKTKQDKEISLAQLAKLARGAKRATKGWAWWKLEACCGVGYIMATQPASATPEQVAMLRLFCNTASPDTILRLIALARKAKP